MRDVFTPGEGFPDRLRELLARRGKRVGEAAKEVPMDRDTLSGWLNALHFPEKKLFLDFCRSQKINAQAARLLIRLPHERDLILATKQDKVLMRLERLLQEGEPLLAQLDESQRVIMAARFRKIADTLCLPTTTTET